MINQYLNLMKILLLSLLLPHLAFASHNQSFKIVKAWAKAVKERDGKKQYLLLCSHQKEKNRASLEAMNWVTGVSSPQIGSYKIKKLKQKKDITTYSLHYQLLLQGKLAGGVTDKIDIKKDCITKFKYLSPSGEAPTTKR